MALNLSCVDLVCDESERRRYCCGKCRQLAINTKILNCDEGKHDLDITLYCESCAVAIRAEDKCPITNHRNPSFSSAKIWQAIQHNVRFKCPYASRVSVNAYAEHGGVVDTAEEEGKYAPAVDGQYRAGHVRAPQATGCDWTGSYVELQQHAVDCRFRSPESKSIAALTRQIDALKTRLTDVTKLTQTLSVSNQDLANRVKVLESNNSERKPAVSLLSILCCVLLAIIGYFAYNNHCETVELRQSMQRIQVSMDPYDARAIDQAFGDTLGGIKRNVTALNETVLGLNETVHAHVANVTLMMAELKPMRVKLSNVEESVTLVQSQTAERDCNTGLVEPSPSVPNLNTSMLSPQAKEWIVWSGYHGMKWMLQFGNALSLVLSASNVYTKEAAMFLILFVSTHLSLDYVYFAERIGYLTICLLLVGSLTTAVFSRTFGWDARCDIALLCAHLSVWYWRLWCADDLFAIVCMLCLCSMLAREQWNNITGLQIFISTLCSLLDIMLIILALYTVASCTVMGLIPSYPVELDSEFNVSFTKPRAWNTISHLNKQLFLDGYIRSIFDGTDNHGIPQCLCDLILLYFTRAQCIMLYSRCDDLKRGRCDFIDLNQPRHIHSQCVLTLKDPSHINHKMHLNQRSTCFYQDIILRHHDAHKSYHVIFNAKNIIRGGCVDAILIDHNNHFEIERTIHLPFVGHGQIIDHMKYSYDLKSLLAQDSNEGFLNILPLNSHNDDGDFRLKWSRIKDKKHKMKVYGERQYLCHSCFIDDPNQHYYSSSNCNSNMNDHTLFVVNYECRGQYFNFKTAKWNKKDLARFARQRYRTDFGLCFDAWNSRCFISGGCVDEFNFKLPEHQNFVHWTDCYDFHKDRWMTLPDTLQYHEANPCVWFKDHCLFIIRSDVCNQRELKYNLLPEQKRMHMTHASQTAKNIGWIEMYDTRCHEHGNKWQILPPHKQLHHMLQKCSEKEYVPSKIVSCMF